MGPAPAWPREWDLLRRVNAVGSYGQHTPKRDAVAPHDRCADLSVQDPVPHSHCSCSHQHPEQENFAVFVELASLLQIHNQSKVQEHTGQYPCLQPL
jgi:hypothetical protein